MARQRPAKRRGKPPPKCKAILLCDQVIVDALTRKVSIIGTFDSFNTPSFPGMTAQFTAFMQMTDGHGEYRIAIEIHDLQEGTVLGRAEGAPISFPDRTAKLNYFIPVPPLPLAHAGRYDFVVFADGQEIDRQQFEAREIGIPPDGNHAQPQ
jgi:hypothetical protein